MGGNAKEADTGRGEVLGTIMQCNTITTIAFHKKKTNIKKTGALLCLAFHAAFLILFRGEMYFLVTIGI